MRVRLSLIHISSVCKFTRSCADGFRPRSIGVRWAMEPIAHVAGTCVDGNSQWPSYLSRCACRPVLAGMWRRISAWSIPRRWASGCPHLAHGRGSVAVNTAPRSRRILGPRHRGASEGGGSPVSSGIAVVVVSVVCTWPCAKLRNSGFSNTSRSFRIAVMTMFRVIMSSLHICRPTGSVDRP